MTMTMTMPAPVPMTNEFDYVLGPDTMINSVTGPNVNVGTSSVISGDSPMNNWNPIIIAGLVLGVLFMVMAVSGRGR